MGKHTKSPFDRLVQMGLIAYGCVNLSGGILPYVTQALTRAVDYQDWGRCFPATIAENTPQQTTPTDDLTTLKTKWAETWQTISHVDADGAMRNALHSRNVQICAINKNGYLGEYVPFVDHIYFDVATPQPAMIATAMHEIRHLQQDIAAPEWGNLFQTPKQKLTRLFLAEADAEAYAVRKSWLLQEKFGDTRAWNSLIHDGIYNKSACAFLQVMTQDNKGTTQSPPSDCAQISGPHLNDSALDRLDLATRAAALAWLHNDILLDGYGNTFKNHHTAHDLWSGWVDDGFIQKWRAHNPTSKHLDSLVIGTAERAVYYQDPRAKIKL